MLQPRFESGSWCPEPCTSALMVAGKEMTCVAPTCFTSLKFFGSTAVGRSKSRATVRSVPAATCSSSTNVEPPQTMPTSSTRSPGRGFSSAGSSSNTSSRAADASASTEASDLGARRRSSIFISAIVYELSQVVGGLLQLGVEVVAQADERLEACLVAVEQVAAFGLGQFALHLHVVEVDDRPLAHDHLVGLLDDLGFRLRVRSQRGHRPENGKQ